jgi:hypothetical protein
VKSRPREKRGHFAASPHRSKRAIGTILIEVTTRVGARADDQLDAKMHRRRQLDLEKYQSDCDRINRPDREREARQLIGDDLPDDWSDKPW